MPVRGAADKLVHAAVMGDDAKVKRLLKANADVDAEMTTDLEAIRRHEEEKRLREEKAAELAERQLQARNTAAAILRGD